MPEKHCSYAALEGKYVLHKTLGTGGFAKVKLATHVLTNEKVAIKIMNKAALGDDLPRVQLEIEALRVLNHPNICKLYQVMETEKNYFIVLEYCPGGELFDYIIEKDRVTEKEAKIFFRQIIGAVAFIHEKGYVHRDLKPENLLLDNEQNLKLIDFGLCAKPKTGMQQQLETCCGSPAYAAPELITGDNYNGNKVDIWSMGVLLYALLCGFLPFDDENVTKLYKKIQKGRYFCPSWLSSESKALLSQMLQVDPAKRISIEELMSHSWITEGLETTDWNTYKEAKEFDPDCLAELAVYYRRPMRSIEISLNQCKFDYLSATYELLLSKKIAGKSFSLMKQQSVLKDSKFRENTSRTFDTSPVLKTVSMDSLTDSDLLVLGSPQNMSKTSIYSSKAASPSIISKDKDDKENFILPLAPSTKKNKKSTTSMNKNKLISNENYCIGSPKSLVFSASLDTAVNEIGEASSNVISLYTCDKRAKSFESPSFNAMTPKRRPPRQIGSSAKKVFGSIEKGLDCVKNLLTPKKRICGTLVPRQVKNLGNVSATNDKVTPEDVLESLQNALLRKGIPCKQKGFTLCGKICEGKKIKLRFELEVCQLPKHQHAVGVKRKRLQGDAWHYKRHWLRNLYNYQDY
ncbi:maternal embryonic leucine zipper kinase [Caerostris darwini]|uniref:non-specific serine/threonine protein kinase n=1 Tax=Caerostris darwini TaxID=1538125 RepID=A0AAV4S8C7_9ARAC|nr:maternal embryonic leucine zipper kinase [Caerostris darwini]